jgi:hypothetical protein
LPLIAALGRLRQEDYLFEFQDSIDYKANFGDGQKTRKKKIFWRC